jgi:hypothetical protein
VSYKESSGVTLYSTQNWAETTVEGLDMNLGKWGMTMEYYHKEEDLNGDGVISSDPVSFEFGGTRSTSENPDEVFLWRTVEGDETNVPTLMMIGGDTVDAGSLVSDVWASAPGILCELEGRTCSNRGTCGPGVTGCVCDSLQYTGEYCEVLNTKFVAAGIRVRPMMALILVAMGIVTASLM